MHQTPLASATRQDAPRALVAGVPKFQERCLADLAHEKPYAAAWTAAVPEVGQRAAAGADDEFTARLTDEAGQALQSLTGRGIVRPDFIRSLVDERLAQHSGYCGEMVWILMMLGQRLLSQLPAAPLRSLALNERATCCAL